MDPRAESGTKTELRISAWGNARVAPENQNQRPSARNRRPPRRHGRAVLVPSKVRSVRGAHSSCPRETEGQRFR